MIAALPELMTEPEQSPPKPAEPKPLPGDDVLVNKMPEWFQAPRVLAFYIACLGMLYCLLNYQPLWHTDLWGHLSYGRMIWETGKLPATEPLMPLASGVRFVDTAWLSQIIGYSTHLWSGVPGLQFLYASAATLCFALLVWKFHRRSHRVSITLLGCCAFGWVAWQHLMIVRPQLAGLLCFIATLCVVTSSRWSRVNWILIPVLFAVWANLHGSFIVGLALLASCCLGRAWDCFRRSGRLASIVRDRKVRRYFLLTELAAVAVLLNPYGLGLYAEVFSFASNENLADLVEWGPLTLKMRQGQAALAIALAVMCVYRLSPRRIACWEVLSLVGFGTAALLVSRMIVWWAPVAAYCLVLHGTAVWNRHRKNCDQTKQSPSSSTWAVVSLGLLWISFAYTPFGMRILHGPQPEMEKRLSVYTPVLAVEYLREHPPEGQIFNTYEWGDYLLWAGPKDLQVFVASHAHLVPQEVWQHYMQVIQLGSGWDKLLDRYSVNTVVIDTQRRKPLIDRLRSSDEWRVDYEDNRAVIFVRQPPI